MGGGTEPLIITPHADLMPDTGTRYTMDKTWQEIYDAFPNACVVGEDEYEKLKVNHIYADDAPYFYVDVGDPSGIFEQYHTDNTDGYPFMEVIG